MTPELVQHIRGVAESVDSFRSLTYETRGALPSTAVDILQFLSQDKRSIKIIADRFLEQARSQAVVRPWSDPALPISHPLDADWRFTRSSAKELLRTALRNLPCGSTVLLMCTPTLVRTILTQGLPYRFVFVARSADVVTRAILDSTNSIEFRDICDDLRSISADITILDPPWYDDIALPMIRKAMRATKVGSKVLVCVPDVFSGCSSAPTLSDSISLSASLSSPVREARILVRYETPLFELNTLFSNDVRDFHPQWRTGRVFEIDVKSVTRDAVVLANDEWTEVSFGSCRIRTRRGGSARGGLGNLRIASSVSRRTRDELHPTVITSGNRCGTGTIELSAQFPGRMPTSLKFVAARENVEAQKLLCREPARAYSPVDNLASRVHIWPTYGM